MQRVLITALGTMNCTTIVNELKRYDDVFYLIGADINPGNQIANSKDVDEFHVFPKVTENQDAYYDYLKRFCIEKKIDIIYCVVDEEVVFLSKKRDELSSLGVTLCIANDEVVSLCHDKNKFSNWIKKNIPDISIKRYVNFSDVTETDYPVFIKPTEGRASIGCVRINTPKELECYKPYWDNYIVEEYIESPVVAVDIISNQLYGQVEMAQRLELLRNANGCGIAVQIIENEQIRKYCMKIVEKINLNGVVNVEFFLTDKGPKIIEINPRIPAGVEYSCLAGLNVVLNALNISIGKPCEFNPIKIGKHYAKRYETIEM